MREIVVLSFAGSGVLGGGETLVMRMVQWLNIHNYHTAAMYNQSANLVPQLLSFLNQYQVEKIIVPDLPFRPDLIDFTRARAVFPPGSKIKIICIQNSFTFFAAQMLKHTVSGCQIDIFHYIIHESDYCGNLSQRVRMPLIHSFLQAHDRKIVMKMEHDHGIAYMSKDYHDHIYSVLGIPGDRFESLLIPLGMEIPAYSEELTLQRFSQGKFTIAAMARLDFPTKGFLIGLIDEFEAVFVKNPNVRLLVIGDGPGREELEKKIAGSAARNAVTMLGQLSYGQITDYLKQSNLFIGNGTGPLDAAKVGVPSIVANFNTRECLARGYWCDDIENLGYRGTVPVREFLFQILQMQEDEYLSLCRRNYEAFHETYSMDTMMNAMLNIENTSKRSLLSYPFLYLTKFFRMLIDVLPRKRN